jgi:para-nitrobenzyl esterase
VRTAAGAEADGVELAKAVGCEDAECLRRAPAKALLDAFEAEGMNAGPVAGRDVLPLQPRAAFERGRFNRMPVMHGNTLDEMRLFVALTYPQPITQAQYEGIVRAAYGARADEVLKRYPAGADARIALSTIQTDSGGALSTCLHQTAFGLFERAGVPVYAYQFADRTAPPLIDVPGFEEGAEHGTELTYLFPGLLGELDEGQQRLSDHMVDYWTSFAHQGRPEARAERWPRFRSAGDVLSLAPGRGGITTADTSERSRCAFWSTLQ